MRKARRLRKQNRLHQAKRTYEEVLSIDPKEIRAYNGIRKILLGKKDKEYEVIQLYQSALIHLPNNNRIKQRLYNEYFKAAVGNRKVLRRINIPGRMLVYVKEKYEELLELYPEQKNLQKQLEKIEKYILLDVDQSSPHRNKALKEYRKANCKKHRLRFDELSSQETTNKLLELKAKPVSSDRKHHIRELYKVNLIKLRKEKKYIEAFDSSYDYLMQEDRKDPYFMKQYRDLGKQLKRYDYLISFETMNHTEKKNFWSALSLFDSYYRKAKEQNLPIISSAESLLLFMEQKIDDPRKAFEVVTRKICLNIINNNVSLAKEQIIDKCHNMAGASNPHLIDRMNIICAEYYKKTANQNDKKDIINIATSPKLFIENSDELKKSLALMNINRSYNKPVHLLNLINKINSI